MQSNKQKQLDAVAAEIAKCRACRKDKVGVSVPGEGSAEAKVVFIGEAPGKKESVSGRPFIGPAGKFLRALISSSGLREDEVFITSPVKYLPKHITPTPDEIAHGRIHLAKQLEIIEPEVVVLMGRVACLAILQKNCSIASEHGKIIESGNVKYFLSYHPAAALHAPNLRPVLAKDFLKLKKLISKK